MSDHATPTFTETRAPYAAVETIVALRSPGSASLDSEIRHYHDTILNGIKPLIVKYGNYVKALVDITSQATRIMVDIQAQKKLLRWNEEARFEYL